MNEQNLDNLRHSCAHLLAKAVRTLWPGSHNAIGPAIENGFYQDFDMGKVKISEADILKIEEKMRELLPTWQKFTFREVSLDEAKKLFAHNPYKVEMAIEFAKEGKKLMTNDPGDFLDLCKMGHVDNPSKELQHFKLLSVAGAYWRGDEKNKMLTRIYGTCFPTKEELDHYVWQQEEAKKRDHRKIGKELGLFFFSPSVGSGLPLYLPKGLLIRRQLEQWLTAEKEKRDYQFVWTPHIAKSELYKQSGHWAKYDAMIPPMTIEEEEYVVKPMNCPHHFQIYREHPRSYRDLPLRIAENATVYRYEKSGELNGLFRVRALTQDDTHTFVRHDQIGEEIDRVIDLAKYVFDAFKFSHYKARISTRDKKHPKKFLGNPASWDKAQKALIDAARRKGLDSFIGEGEAAFYGPKIDIIVSDALGREWQLTTVQLDFVQPENFDLTYVNERGKPERPAVLHIAILGSVDRFLAILIEHYAGAFPTWLAPVQVVVIPIAERHTQAGKQAVDALKKASLRVEIDERNDTMQAKIREATLQKVPYMGIIGDKEVDGGTVSVRTRSGEDLGLMPVEAFARILQEKIESGT